MVEKIDFKKVSPGYRAKASEFQVLTLEPTRYLMVDGTGDPNTSTAYTQAVESLYPIAYKLKFASKQIGRDYVVPPLEGLWWADDLTSFTDHRDKSLWHWTLMLMIPRWLDDGDALQAKEAAQASKNLPAADKVRIEVLDEGQCVQTLHVGTYDDEGPVLKSMHEDFIPKHGLQMTGKHHEIYLGDPRRVTPEKLRTILRQPVQSL